MLYLLYPAIGIFAPITLALLLRLLKKLEAVQVLLVVISTLGALLLFWKMKEAMSLAVGILILCGFWVILFAKNGRIRGEKLNEPSRRRIEIIAITMMTFAVVGGSLTPGICQILELNQKNKLPAQVMEALNRDPNPILYSIEPMPLRILDDKDTPAPPREGPFFHDNKILGEAVLKSPERETILTAFKNGMSSWDGKFANCFEPRHGLRVKGDSGTYDFVICFECRQLYLYLPNDRTEKFGITGDARVFNEVLTALKIPLAKQ